MLTTIKLYGKLGKKYGKIHKYAVRTIREALSALEANHPGFRQDIDPKDGFHILVDKQDYDKDQLEQPIGSGKTIKILPAIKGADEIFAIVVGAFLIWATWGVGLTASIGAAGNAFVQGIGVSLLMQGVSALLFKPDEPPEDAETDLSSNFDGAYNTTAEGMPVPIGYGTMEVGSAIISAHLHASDESVEPIDSSGTAVRIGRAGKMITRKNNKKNSDTNITTTIVSNI